MFYRADVPFYWSDLALSISSSSWAELRKKAIRLMAVLAIISMGIDIYRTAWTLDLIKRFDQIEIGMSQNEVADILGPWVGSEDRYVSDLGEGRYPSRWYLRNGQFYIAFTDEYIVRAKGTNDKEIWQWITGSFRFELEADD